MAGASGPPRLGVPDHDRFALVGDGDRIDVADRSARRLRRSPAGRCVPDIAWPTARPSPAADSRHVIGADACATTRPSASTARALVLVVPWSIARIRPLLICACGRAAACAASAMPGASVRNAPAATRPSRSAGSPGKPMIASAPARAPSTTSATAPPSPPRTECSSTVSDRTSLRRLDDRRLVQRVDRRHVDDARRDALGRAAASAAAQRPVHHHAVGDDREIVALAQHLGLADLELRGSGRSSAGTGMRLTRTNTGPSIAAAARIACSVSHGSDGHDQRQVVSSRSHAMSSIE